jgi:lysophospholipase L1-like esterase
MNMGHNRCIKIGLSVCLLLAQMAYGGENKSQSDNYTYLALGDSYTIGQSVAVQARYPVQVVARLNAEADPVQAPEIIAGTGWTTRDLLEALAAGPPSRATYHVVTLLIGVNNQFQERSLSEYQAEFTRLLQQCIHWAGDTASHVIVLSIPDYGASFYGQQTADLRGISMAIDEFNSVKGGCLPFRPGRVALLREGNGLVGNPAG